MLLRVQSTCPCGQAELDCRCNGSNPTPIITVGYSVFSRLIFVEQQVFKTLDWIVFSDFEGSTDDLGKRSVLSTLFAKSP